MSKRIIVVVSGGLVTDVYSDEDDVEVSVLDYDNMEVCDPELDDEKEEYEGYALIEKEIETLLHVW